MLGGLFRNKKVAPMPTYVAPAIAEAAPTQPSPVEQGPNVVGSSMSPSVRNSVSVLSQLDSDSTQVLSQAENETKKINQSAIEPEQILIGLLYDRVIFSPPLVVEFFPEFSCSFEFVF